MSDLDRLREALRQIDGDLRWFFACGGHVSRDDMVGMIGKAQKRIDAVRDVAWPEPAQPIGSAPLDNDF